MITTRNLPTDVENIVIYYISDENLDSKNYLPEQKYSGHLNFFQNRLPVTALCLHVIHGEYEEASSLVIYRKTPKKRSVTYF